MYQQQNSQLLQLLDQAYDALKPKHHGDSEKIPFFGMKQTNRSYYYRLLPSKCGEFPIETFFIHYGFYNPNTDKNGAFPCIKPKGMRCPLCEHIEQLSASGDPTAKDLVAKQAYAVYAVDKQSEKVGVLSFSGARSFNAIFDQIKASVIEHGTLGVDLNVGNIYRIDKSGSQMQTEYKAYTTARNDALSSTQVSQYDSFPSLKDIYGDYTEQDYLNVVSCTPFIKEVEMKKKGLTNIPQQAFNPTFQQQAPAMPNIGQMPGANQVNPQIHQTIPQNPYANYQSNNVPNNNAPNNGQQMAQQNFGGQFAQPSNFQMPPQSTMPSNMPNQFQGQRPPELNQTSVNPAGNNPLSAGGPSLAEIQQMLGMK